jgi:hypothetical protein
MSQLSVSQAAFKEKRMIEPHIFSKSRTGLKETTRALQGESLSILKD